MEKEKNELLEYGISVFNYEEEKFYSWLKKPNFSLGGTIPENILDSIKGREEVKKCLNRIEHGNFS